MKGLKKRRLFHISPDDLGEEVLFYPRIPYNRFEGGEVFHPYIGETIYAEDEKIKRICVSDSIRGCFKAMPFDREICYVYSPLSPMHVTRDLPLILVPDAKETREHWILSKAWMVKIGEIQILEYDGVDVVKYKWSKKFKV